MLVRESPQEFFGKHKMLDHTIESYREETIKIRRDLHRIPEIGLDTQQTSDYLEDQLRKKGIPAVRVGSKKTGLVATLNNKKSFTLGIRADIDGLPIKEETRAEYSSSNENMHACGHDAHAAVALASAVILKELEEKLNCNIQFIFQPGEEGSDGAEDILRNGFAAISPSVNEMIALHVNPEYGVGTIAYRAGAIMASATPFGVKIIGKAGHPAMPHLCIDPIYIASQFISQAQSIASRSINPSDPVVISFKSINSSKSYGQIPSEVEIYGTLRALSGEGCALAKKRLNEILQGLSQGYASKHELNFYPENGSPLTSNDPKVIKNIDNLDISGIKLLNNCRPLFGAEDFSSFSERFPSAYLFLGCRSPGNENPLPLHNSQFDIDESCLDIGTRFLCRYALSK